MTAADGMRGAVALLLWTLLAGAGLNAGDVIEAERVRVFDGDTIAVLADGQDLRLRLHAIDTPDQEQALYREATDALQALLDDRRLRIELVAETYNRQAAVILAGDRDIGAEMIRAGWAYAHRKYLGLSTRDAAYCALEHEAREAGRGLWALPPRDRIAPWQLRQSYRGARSAFTDFSAETVANCEAAAGREDLQPGTIAAAPMPGLTPPDPDCPIKGDISATGKKRYALPGMHGYAAIFINETNGERWFCSEAEAIEAGWARGR